jgi:cyclopropane-fatty-acyl-phospholipid synthase
VHDARTYGALLRSGSVGLGTSYVAGWWDTDDLTALVRALFWRTQRLRTAMDRLGRFFSGPLDLPARLCASGREDDRRNVRAHYDLSNAFFEIMLDETMSYSCALFGHAGMSLRDAQVAKIDRICHKLDLQPDDHVIEIGSGWGGFALHAARCYGSRVTTTTISERQRDYVAEQVNRAGLTDRITVLGEDWRDLRGRFTKVVSVEMIEAVDWRLHDRFLAACSSLLVENGLAVLQAIVIDDGSFERAKRHQDFVRKMVFPGGCLPSVTSITSSLARATDLRTVDLEDIGPHYVETLRRWATNMAERATDLDNLGLSREFRRLWALYLAYCEASFMERHVSDVQLVLAKPGWRGTLSPRSQ